MASHAIAPPPLISPPDRLGLTVFVAIVVHVVVILGVTFAPDEPTLNRPQALDVILVQSRTPAEVAPETADFLAQASQEGGGESEKPARPATPLRPSFTSARPQLTAAAPPVPPSPAREVVRMDPTPAKPATDEPEAHRPPPPPMLAQITRLDRPKVFTAPVANPVPEARRTPRPKQSDRAERKAKPAPRPVKKPPPPAPTLNAATLVSRSLAMASLTAEVDQRLDAYAKRPRSKWISSRTREHKFAAYMESWRQKVERIGNLNYPDEARRRRLSGSLLLDVALLPDGSVREISLRRSSGKKVLDDAAMRIVRLAAPYAKFPEAIAAEVDILHIERTWRFMSSNQFVGR